MNKNSHLLVDRLKNKEKDRVQQKNDYKNTAQTKRKERSKAKLDLNCAFIWGRQTSE